MLLEKIDYLITSRDIPARLTGNQNLRQSLPEVRDRYSCRLTAATLGHEGVLAWDGSGFHYAPALFRAGPKLWTNGCCFAEMMSIVRSVETR